MLLCKTNAKVWLGLREESNVEEKGVTIGPYPPVKQLDYSWWWYWWQWWSVEVQYLGKFHHSDSSTIGHSFVLDNYIKIIIIPLAVSLWNNSGPKPKEVEVRLWTHPLLVEIKQQGSSRIGIRRWRGVHWYGGGGGGINEWRKEPVQMAECFWISIFPGETN